VHAIDSLKLPSLMSQSSGVLEGYIASMMRSVFLRLCEILSSKSM
jgi:hypothetical protein